MYEYICTLIGLLPAYEYAEVSVLIFLSGQLFTEYVVVTK